MHRSIVLVCVFLLLCASAEAKPKSKKPAPLLVKDSRGKLVGPVLGQTDDAVLQVVRKINGQAVVFFVNAAGFTNDPREPLPALYYASTDCTGAPLIQENNVTASSLLLPVVGVHGSAAYYGSGSLVAGQSGSAETFDDPGSCDPSRLTPRAGCCTNGLVADKTAPAAMVDLGSLGLTPPFHVEGP